MSDLSCPGIDFDEESVASLLLQHEIESMDAREIKPPDNFFGRRRHLRIFDQPHHSRVPRRTCLVDHFKMKSRQNLPVPAGHSAGSLLPVNKGLRIHHELLAAKR